MDQRVLQNTRIAIGFAQGLLLYALQRAFMTRGWPATDGYIFAPLLAAGFFVPLIAISGLGNLRMRTLWIWLVAATALCGLLTVYDIYRVPFMNGVAGALRIVPQPLTVVGLAALLFICHSLVVAADADRRLIARYPALFEASWKHGIQAPLANLFTGVLWAILFLGAALFTLIKITWIARTIAEPLFWIPVTAVGFAYALHVADVRATIVRGARTLVLVLLSWLLPVMTVLAAGFILTLPFTGLDVLWGTKRATFILLAAAGALVFLINAAYRDGDDDNSAILRVFRLLGAIVLLPLVALAGYALMLRVGQYGWTPERVIAAAMAIVAACYALGYAAAAVRTGLSMRWLEPVNVGTTFVIIAIFLMLMTPFADPARISVNSQLARLETGAVTAEAFDYGFLRLRGGRFGADALEALATHKFGPVAAVYAERVRSGQIAVRPLPPPPAEKRLANITVLHPKGATFPIDFLQKDWSGEPRRYALPRCITSDAKCDAVLVDLDGDGKDEVLLFAAPAGTGAAFKQHGEKDWSYLGNLNNTFCRGFREALSKGDIAVVAPPFKDIQAGGVRASLSIGCEPANVVATPAR